MNANRQAFYRRLKLQFYDPANFSRTSATAPYADQDGVPWRYLDCRTASQRAAWNARLRDYNEITRACDQPPAREERAAWKRHGSIMAGD